MPIPLRFLENPPLRPRAPEGSIYYDGTLDFEKLAVGDLCFYHWRGEPCRDAEHLAKLHLTAHYFAHNAGRAPLVIAMPDRSMKGPRYFMADGQCYSGDCRKCGKEIDECKCGKAYDPRGYYDGWTVTGAPPMITISPSVNFDTKNVKRYHGFVQNGVIGDG